MKRKILLLGEYSGFFSNLKEGFQLNGCEATKISQGDGIKKIENADYSLDSELNGLFGRVAKVIKAYFLISRMKGYDCVIIINPDFFKIFFFEKIIYIIIEYLKNNNNKLILMACGGDSISNQFSLDGGIKYWPNKNCDDVNNKNLTKKMKNICHKLAVVSDLIIPTAWDYAVGWRASRFCSKVSNTIPCCINSNNYNYSFNMSGKIIIYHGLNKECHKGSKAIVHAMKEIEKKYADKVEVIVAKKISLNEYAQVISRVHILIDQCKAHSFTGMNSLLGLAMGKVVFSNAEKECLLEHEILICPVVKIRNNPRLIYKQLEYYINNPQELTQMSQIGHSYVIKNHDSKCVAKKIIQKIDEL